MGGNWYHLKAWEDVYEKKDVVRSAGCVYPSGKSSYTVLGIGDPRTDQENPFCRWQP